MSRNDIAVVDTTSNYRSVSAEMGVKSKFGAYEEHCSIELRRAVKTVGVGESEQADVRRSKYTAAFGPRSEVVQVVEFVVDK